MVFMVLESLYSAKKIFDKPKYMLIASAIITLVCVFASYFIFPAYAGIIAPLLVTATLSPIIYKIFSIEEELDREEAEKKVNIGFFGRHGETIWIFSLFFIGNLIPFFLVAILMPNEFVSSAFAPQIEEIKRIQNIATGSVLNDSFLNVIMINNFKVMGFSFLLSFLFGTGALFILSWNASILAIYFAGFFRQGQFAELFTRTLGIIPHAPVEILAYFFAGIAGGILSVGMIREKFGSKEFNLVLKDSLILFAFGVVSVALGAYLEVYL